MSPVTRKNMLIILDVTWHVFSVCMVFFADILQTRVLDGSEVKHPLYFRFIFEEINDGKRAIMTSLTFSNESAKLFLSLSAASFWIFSVL